MRVVDLPILATWNVWRDAARDLLACDIRPEDVSWRFADGQDGLFDTPPPSPLPSSAEPAAARKITVPKTFLNLAETVCCSTDCEDFALLYQTLWRLQTDKALLARETDPAVARLLKLAKHVRRDSHKMRAFVRFKEIEGGGPRRAFAAWFEPEHNIMERNAPFFARRFADMDWIIATTTVSARHSAGEIECFETVEKPAALTDGTDELWRTYFANIFNPARLKPQAMRSEMPKKYWHNLPEAELIPGLIASAHHREREMIEARAAMPNPLAARIVPEAVQKMTESQDATYKTLTSVEHAASGCERCPLHKNATQTVFGEGPIDADVMIVGEQPGDREDLAGKPFVGPAGQMFDAALQESGIARDQCYITNAVKHFKFIPRGKRRIHQKPDAGEVQHCKWWLELEREFVKPKLVVAMGATAALSLTGNDKGILKRRGSIERTADGTPVLITIHPSAILRIPDKTAAAKARADFVDDLSLIRERLAA